ncbi:MAG: hypothetical protein IKC50_07360 [Oscillospiraceae bacterium]|nr:hypothetical protein [Oscillospiraceae bacterium]
MNRRQRKRTEGKPNTKEESAMTVLAIILAILFIPIGVIFELTKKYM